MTDVLATCLVATALLSYANARWIRLPATIGVMAISLVISLVVIGLDLSGVYQGLRQRETSALLTLDFTRVLMQWMLCFLLFAGALHVDLRALRAYRWPVAGLAFLGTLTSTLLVAAGMKLVVSFMGIPLGWIHCLIFGALISPTDPIAVLGILKSARAPLSVETVIAGESLFNDGVGIVLFSTFAAMLAAGESSLDIGQAGLLMVREAGGGIALGCVLGYLTYVMLKSIDDYLVEVMLMLAAVLGGYAAASHLEVSGPIAMVVCGLLVGNRGRQRAMSETTRRYSDMFWEFIDEILNASLFVLLGAEVLVVSFSIPLLVAGGAAIAISLAVRAVVVGIPLGCFPRFFKLPRGAATVITWGGLRGGISVALALSLAPGEARDAILTLTYCVVTFTVLVQGLTIGRVVTRVGLRH